MSNHNSFLKVQVGDELTIRLYSRGAASSWTAEVRVVAVDVADKDDARVTFEEVTPNGALFTWSIYRFKGRWSYGSSADRVSLVEVH